MITKKIENQSLVSAMMLSSLLVLTGCFGGGEKEKAKNQESAAQSENVKDGEVLLSIDGKPVMYAADFEDQKAMTQQSNQQLNMILQMMPDAEYTMLFKSIEAGQVMKEWVIRSGIDQDPKRLKERQQYHEAIDLQLYMKYYEDAHPISVSDHEAKTFYESRRDQVPGFVLAPASVDVVYVAFEDKAKAESFAGKVKDGSEKHFKAAAKEANVKAENMNVSAQSQVNSMVKNVVLQATKFPSKEIVKLDDNNYWVIGLVKKKDAEYRSFETPEVKKYVVEMCRNEKREAEIVKQVEKLSKEYNVVENKAYFENKKEKQAAALKKAEEIVKQAQAQNGSSLDFAAGENVEELQDLIEDKI